MSWTSLCSVSELEPSKGRYVEIGGFQLAVFLNDGKVFVTDNHCPHAGGNIARGYIENGCAVCPLHFWAFRLESGHMRDNPGVVLRTYPTRTIEHQGSQLVQADLPIY